MKTIYIIIISMIFSFNLFAEKNVFINQKSQIFINDMIDGTAEYHRSGFADDKSSIPEEGKVIWNEGSLKIYEIKESDSTINSVSKEIFQQGLIEDARYNVKKSHDNSSLLIEVKADPRPSDIMKENVNSPESYIEMAKYYIPELEELKNSVEFESISIETSQCLRECKDSFYEEERVSGVYIHFRRLFEGGIVRGSSKITIKLDPDGSLRRFKIIWPEIIEAGFVNASVTFKENVDSFIKTLSKTEAYIEKDSATFAIESFEIEGLAKAWISLKTSKNILIPALSYKLKAFLSDDSEVSKITDVPLTK
ncbi:MAG TPA: hypothetical protein PLW37_13880 [bacterium]|mgnify:CR=1 FL=1|nr:hypothetical protein [bacterium]